MWFDAYAVLAKIEAGEKLEIEPCYTATRATTATNTPETRSKVAHVARVARAEGSNSENAGPDLDAFEERAAIMEFDGDLTRAEAEGLAVRAQGYADVIDFMAVVARLRKRC